jgi:alpha-tubulin suppressor-like RCC1 family protein
VLGLVSILAAIASTSAAGAADTIATGQAHSCALAGAGRVKCWGVNDKGQLGDGTTERRLTSVWVENLNDATAIAAGNRHTCALTETGRVKCWGWNEYGQLGDGTRKEDRLTPVWVENLEGAIAIAAGRLHTCALIDTGRAKCWGRNYNGQIGNGKGGGQRNVNRKTPARVKKLNRATAIAAGGHHSCATKDNGRAKCWGNNYPGQLGDGTTKERLTPVRVQKLNGATAIAAGNRYTCAVKESGRAKCWGSNYHGELGDGTKENRLTPVRVKKLRNAIAIAAGYYHTCAVKETGRAKCWGSNDSGQLGDGTTKDRRKPVRVKKLNGATTVAAGGVIHAEYSCALTDTDRVKCWGSNSSGQLGDGTTKRRLTPVWVEDLP